MMPWSEEAVLLLPELVRLRRAIHGEPELRSRTRKTAAKIMSALAELLLECRRGPSTDGIVAVLRGARVGGTVLFPPVFETQSRTGRPDTRCMLGN
jgi:metal-dependent amidase/aminoacylase/carboxypeptidase family protein